MDAAVREARTALAMQDYELIAEGLVCDGARIAAVVRRRDEVVAIVRHQGVPAPAEQRALSRALMAFLTARRVSEVYARFDVVWLEDGRPMLLADAFLFEPR